MRPVWSVPMDTVDYEDHILAELAELKKEEKDWVLAQIRQAVKPQLSAQPVIPPTAATSRSDTWQPSWIQAACAIIALIIAFGGFAFWCGSLNSDVKYLQKDVSEIKMTLTSIQGGLLVLQTKAAAANPANPANQEEVKNVLAVAKKESISLPLPIIQEGGDRFIEASRESSNAWEPALQLISYRTVLNAHAWPSNGFGPLPAGKTWSYEPTNQAMRVVGRLLPELLFSAGLGVPSAQAARLNLIGKDANADIPTGPLFLILQGGSYRIDNQEIRSVFFKDVEIHYSGAPLIIENVTFINCTFVMDNGANTRSFGRTLLASERIDFRADS